MLHLARIASLPAVLSLAILPARAQDKPWAEILGPSRAVVPATLPEVQWRTDLAAAMGALSSSTGSRR